MKTRGKKVVPIYPVREWEIVEEEFRVEHNLRNETVFSLGNGYLGMRGNFEEEYSGPDGTSLEGTYINGFYDTERLKYPEVAHGYPEKSQTMLNITNGKIIKLYLEDEEFHLFSGKILQYRRKLDLQHGVLIRDLIWRSPAGREARLSITRLVSLTNKHIAAIRYEVIPLNFEGKIRIFSALNGDVQNLQAKKDPRIGSYLKGRVLEVIDKKINEDGGVLLQKTKSAGFLLACAMRNHLERPAFSVKPDSDRLMVGASYELFAKKGETIRFNKYLAYLTSMDCKAELMAQTVEELVIKARQIGFPRLIQEQKDYLAEFWARADIEVKGDPFVQQGLRFNAFHLLQSVGKDGHTNIGAKGLTGEGYEGHYFWDTEIYILPFFLYSNPWISKNLLTYRYNRLEQARKRALEVGFQRGALFPWRTIGGEECSTFFPAGTAQYHINADIAYAIKKYVEVTGDQEFLINFGGEILFETSRIWMELGAFIARKDNMFCINAVTGPDEYTALVDNNYYTNMMARENLYFAYQTATWMKENASERYKKISEKIDLHDGEVALWKKAAELMYIPYDQKLGIFPQDDTFLDKEAWDLEGAPPENFPLLLHYHPLLIYRAQVCKQPDVVLALFLLSHQFTADQKKRNYDYYEKITTHDSSLSPSIFSIVASEIGYTDKAYDYFLSTVRLDLDDYNDNTKDGIHTACMAGSWLCVVYGFAGMRVYDDFLGFAPYLPEGWEEYGCKITYRGRLIGIIVNKNGVSYKLIEGDPINIYHHQEKIRLSTFYNASKPNSP